MSKIIINGLEWTIEEVPTIGTNDCVIGRTLSDKTHIYIRNDLRKTNFKKVIIHELTHAFLYSFGLDQAKPTQEILCDFVSVYAEQIIAITEDYLEKRVLE